MTQTIKSVGTFVAAVFKHWRGWVSGSAIAFALKLVEQQGLTKVPRSVWLLVFVAGLFVSVFRAWSDEHIRADRAAARCLKLEEDNAPDFDWKLGQAAINYKDDSDQTLVLLGGEIVNRGAPSAVLSWLIHYESPTLNTNLSMAIPTRESVAFSSQDEAGAIAFGAADALPTKTTGPIPRGAIVTGRILIPIAGHRVVEVLSGVATITVTITDYRGKQYPAIFRSGGRQRMNILPGERLVQKTAG